VGYNQDAIQTLHELLDSAGMTDPLLYQHLSYLYMIEDENAAALAVLERGLEEYPESIELHYRLGLLHAMLDNHAAALEYMQIVAQQRPADIEVMNNLAYLYAQTEQNLEYAATLARTALNQEERAEFHDTLGWIYFKQQRYDEALEHLRKARAMRPEDPQILEHLERVYAAEGKETRAADIRAEIEKISRNNK
jgi:Flp pilus assembly protein TadD